MIDAIGMRAHGPLALERFGDGELAGWSALQFIETSSITIDAHERTRRDCSFVENTTLASLGVAARDRARSAAGALPQKRTSGP